MFTVDVIDLTLIQHRPAMILHALALLVLAVTRECQCQSLIPPPPRVTNQPYFDPSMLKNQTAHVSRQAELHCRVHSVGNRTVSWIRGRDLRILTVGRYTYTTDLRYEALHQDGTNQWTLRIKSVQPRDQGNYECQISTKPITVFTTYLQVLEPRVEILGQPDLYVQKASMINLTCILHHLPEPPANVRWYHTNHQHRLRNISYSSTRGGISLVVEKGPTTTSYLLIREATDQDTGKYTCVPDNHNSTSVTLHVLNGERPAAIHTNSSVTSAAGSHSTMLVATTLLRLLVHLAQPLT